MPITHKVSDKTRMRLFALNQQYVGAKELFDFAQTKAQAMADEFNKAWIMELDHYDLVPGENISIDFMTGVITVKDLPPSGEAPEPTTEPTPIRPEATG